MPESLPRILILGVGNVLFRDEGAGVHALRRLEAGYDFASNVTLMDGGVLGMNLLAVMAAADQVIVLDAVRGGQEPGTVYRFNWDMKPGFIAYKDSLHQIDLVETMNILPLVASAPQVTVLGIEYEDIDNLGLQLTPKVAKALEPLLKEVLDLLERLGAPARPKEIPLEVADVFGGTSTDH